MKIDDSKFSSVLHQLVTIIYTIKDIGHLDLAIRLESIKEELLMSIDINSEEENMGLENVVQKFVVNIMLKKGVKSAVKLIISFLASAGTVKVLETTGVDIKVDETALTAGLTLIANSGLEMLRNFVKHKFNKNIF